MRGLPVYRQSTSVSSTNQSAWMRAATCAESVSLSPNLSSCTLIVSCTCHRHHDHDNQVTMKRWVGFGVGWRVFGDEIDCTMTIATFMAKESHTAQTKTELCRTEAATNVARP